MGKEKSQQKIMRIRKENGISFPPNGPQPPLTHTTYSRRGAVKRDPIDTFGIVSQSQTRHATMAANASKTPPPRAHKLGFASSDAMPGVYLSPLH